MSHKMTFLAVLTVSMIKGIDARSTINNNQLQMHTEQTDDFMDTNINNINRFFSFSRQLDDKTVLFRSAAEALETYYDSLNREALILARQALSPRFSPGGLSTRTSKVTVRQDGCHPLAARSFTGIHCNFNDPFRTITGVCNNIDNPLQGALSTQFPREIEVTEYDPKHDFMTFMEPLTQSQVAANVQNGSFGSFKLLPSPRTVSNNFHVDTDFKSDVATTMVVQFGQFLDHDVTLTPEHEELHCCDEDFDHENCYSIPVSLSDPFYGSRGVHCLEFMRSVAFCEQLGGPRQQVNAITAFVDASNVYGSDDQTENMLRSFTNGKLKTDGNNQLPIINGEAMAGDVRAREMPGLATMHTLFLKEHNRICDLIIAEHPDWSDEEIFQNARRIMIAEYQSVVYGQFLPVVLGERSMSGLLLKEEGSEYNRMVDASMTNEFATAAFRFGHSMLQGVIKMFETDNLDEVDEFNLHEGLFNLEKYYKDNGKGMEQLLMGLCKQNAQLNDKGFTTEVTQNLFTQIGKDYGGDLVARNIQRGRDHGLPSFCHYYKLYDDPNADCSKGWEERYNGIDEESWAQLQRVYLHPSDIDLFTGGSAQTPVNGGVIGKVFNAMNANQWRKSMEGDRFFFTHKDEAGSFTTDARKALINRTLAGIICDNTGIKSVPQNVFKPTESGNFISCNDAPSLGDIKTLLEIDN